ncbi:MAG: LLM class flavin-dependent oxidoreductase [Acidimicrobiales bacterium]|nr:LLM class flavin-dependent oxidoreductase [Acidimicrobiales bacterium]MCB9371655.1 LLM class flavin-dependent oxidoreductase [Microthrixaceae bacterium]
MEIGIALPTMAPGYGPATTVDWARGADEGPFSSISTGERISFDNQDWVGALAAAAAVTERVRVMANVVVLPLHPTAEVAKQVATLDQLSGGRFTLGVGVGGREHDYRSLGAPFARRHARLDEQVAELRRLWAGEPPFDGADPVGPPPLQPGGPPLLAGALGPKALARAARWADGVTGFSVAGAADEMATTFRLAEQAWHDAGRSTAPRKVNGCFYLLGEDDAAARDELRRFAARYLGVFGREFAEAMAAETRVWSVGALHGLLDGAEEAGCDEVVLVPGTVDRACLDRTVAALADRR